MARIHRVSQINMLVKSEVTAKNGLTLTVRKVAELIDANKENKYYKQIDISETEAKLLQEITPAAVKEWEWEAYKMQNAINYKGVTAKYENARMLPNIIDYGAPEGECGLCGHAIRYGFTLKNTVNGNTLIVGSECIHNYGVNVVGGDIGAQAEEVVKAAQKRLENEVKIEAFKQNFPNVKQEIANFKKILEEMPINLAQELYDVRSAYWVDRKRDIQRLGRLEIGLAKNGMLNKKQINVLEDIRELFKEEYEAAVERYQKKTGHKLNPTAEDKKKASEEYAKQMATFTKMYEDFAEYGFKSKWIDGIFDTFKRKMLPLTDKQKTIINDQYKLFKQVKEKKEAEKAKTPEQKQEEKEVTLEDIKKNATVLVTMKKWLAKRNNILAVAMEGYIEKESAKGIYFVGHASSKATICCSICGKGLDNKLSRLIGIGPICAGKVGIDRGSLADLSDENIAAMQEKIESHVFKGWLPKAYIEITPLNEAMKRAQEERKIENATETEEEALGTVEF